MKKDRVQELVNEINQILNSRERVIFENYQHVRDQYQNHYEWPELDTLRREAVLAIIFDLNQAAITFTNHMLEALLKISIGYFDAFDEYRKKNEEVDADKSIKGFINQLSPSFKNVDGQNLNNTINMAAKRGLINKGQRKQLHIFRERLRNAYSHADKGKTFGDLKTTIQGLHMNDDGGYVNEPETEVEISDLIFSIGISQFKHAKEHAISYFKYVDSLTRQIKDILFPEAKIDKNK